jgi:Xaa-Pro dipeptidase
VARVRPRDYWYDTAPPAASYWEAEVELIEAESYAGAVAGLGELPAVAYVGDSGAAAAEAGIPAERAEPAALMAPLDWHRATKTEHEAARTAIAVEAAAAGHRAAREAFEQGAPEIEIHRAYLGGCDLLERDMPYGTITALDEKSAILHYQHKRRAGATRGEVLLVDAGAAADGYAADLTRTWARPDADPVFRCLLAGLDLLQRDLVAMVTPGRPYPEIHFEAHRRVAALLAEAGVIKVGVDEAVERGLARAFMPHGVGHHLGLQVHDVGGHQAGPDGGTAPPPDDHPFLRNTRTLEPGHLVTIEPGFYFIPMLLEPLRAGEHAAAVDWKLIERLERCGGARIEDDVLCTEDGRRDLSRPYLPGPAVEGGGVEPGSSAP